ncbi:MAG TPA: M12 family metallopeptidase [Candidatus Limnocylindrales bacterium]
MVRGTGSTNARTDAAAFDEIVRHARGTGTAKSVGCYVRSVPPRLSGEAASFAARMNPANRTPLEALNLPPGVLAPAALTVLVSKYWGPQQEEYTVSFMERTPANLRARIVEHMNAWSTRIGKSFVETASGPGLIRISLDQDGYWSYLGTDVALIPEDQPTMSLQDFSMSTPESEYRRVVRHETGHTLGFPHEHMRAEVVARIDPKKAYKYFLENQGWDQATVDDQVLTPLDAADILGTPPDEDSIMCYQLPGEITYDGKDIDGGEDINATDFHFAEKLYPQADGTGSGRRKGSRKAGATKSATPWMAEDWGPGNDVDLSKFGQ